MQIALAPDPQHLEGDAVDEDLAQELERRDPAGEPPDDLVEAPLREGRARDLDVLLEQVRSTGQAYAGSEVLVVVRDLTQRRHAIGA